MQKTILLAATALLGTGRTLAQTADPTDNQDAPFVRNIRTDRPGQTVTTNMLRPGQFQLEAGTQRIGSGTSSSLGLLRIGFFNHMELRVTQGLVHAGQAVSRFGTEAGQPTAAAAGFAPLTVGAKWLASTTQDARSQVVFLTELTLPRTGDASLMLARPVPAARVLVSQQLGQRYGLEANLGFRQTGFKAADTKKGQFLYTVALNGPLGQGFGFFLEQYATKAASTDLAPGATLGLNWRPLPALRVDVTAGRTFSGIPATTVGAGLAVKLQ